MMMMMMMMMTMMMMMMTLKTQGNDDSDEGHDMIKLLGRALAQCQQGTVPAPVLPMDLLEMLMIMRMTFPKPPRWSTCAVH